MSQAHNRAYAQIWRRTRNTMEILLVLNAAKDIQTEEGELIERDEGWSLPGGGLQDGELPREGCLRETGEEAGREVAAAVEPNIEEAVDKNGVNYQQKSDSSLAYMFHAVIEDEEPVIDSKHDPAGVVVDAKFIDPQDFMMNRRYNPVAKRMEYIYTERDEYGNVVRERRVYNSTVRRINNFTAESTYLRMIKGNT